MSETSNSSLLAAEVETMLPSLSGSWASPFDSVLASRVLAGIAHAPSGLALFKKVPFTLLLLCPLPRPAS